MHDYQKRSSSPNLAALQAYQRKLAADKASSRFGSPIPTNNPEPTNLSGKKRLLPSQMLEARMMQRMQQANAVDSTDGEQEVQGKGDWQQKADLNAIFSNGSTLSSGLMAKYENLMPGVSLGQVSLHQGSQVDAALQTAGLHGLTDGTNVAVASTAPSGTLEHEIGHVAQRQEQGFSLNEVNRQAHEVDADNISAKLLSDRPVERFGQTVNDPGLAAQLQIKAIGMTQAKCSQCEDNQPGFVQQLMAKSLAPQSELTVEENLYAVNPLQRPPRPPRQNPNHNNCPQILLDIIAYLAGGVLRDGKTTIKRGQPERHQQMLDDFEGLYGDGSFPHLQRPGKNGTWGGHQDIYQKQREALQKLLDDWDNDSCDNWGKGQTNKAIITQTIKKARKWAATPAPEKPKPRNPNPLDSVQIPIPDIDLSWLSALGVWLLQFIIPGAGQEN